MIMSKLLHMIWLNIIKMIPQFEFNVKEETNLPSKDCTVNLNVGVKITLELQTAMEMENLIFI